MHEPRWVYHFASVFRVRPHVAVVVSAPDIGLARATLAEGGLDQVLYRCAYPPAMVGGRFGCLPRLGVHGA